MKTRYLFFFIASFIFIHCSSSDELKGDMFIGKWEVRDESFSRIDGIQQPNVYIQNYILELNSNNCGFRYDLDLDTTNIIKWVFQDWSQQDVILISTSLNSSQSFTLFSNELYEIAQLTPDKIKMVKNTTNFEDGKEINSVNSLFLTPR